MFANVSNDSLPADGLVYPKEEGSVSLDTRYRLSTDFFDSSGNREDTFSDGSQQRYHDVQFLWELAYGLTDDITFWLEFPILYRKETRSLNRDDSGFGDVQAGVRCRYWETADKKFEFAFDLSGKFPTGDTDVNFSDPSRGIEEELPMGSGNSNLTPTLFFKQHLSNRWSLEESAGYTFRFDSIIEFLRTNSVAQTTQDGTTVVLPVGNLRLDWGDEIDLRARIGWSATDRLTLSNDVHYFYRRETLIQVISLTTDSSGNPGSTRSDLSLRSAYVLFVRPSISYDILGRLRLRAAVEIPLIGDSYPSIPLVESLVGNLYQMELHYAF